MEGTADRRDTSAGRLRARSKCGVAALTRALTEIGKRGVCCIPLCWRRRARSLLVCIAWTGSMVQKAVTTESRRLIPYPLPEHTITSKHRLDQHTARQTMTSTIGSTSSDHSDGSIMHGPPGPDCASNTTTAQGSMVDACGDFIACGDCQARCCKCKGYCANCRPKLYT